MPGQELLGISEVSRATGLKSSALRYYEKAGLIEPEGRRAGRREYGLGVLQRLAVISLLQEAGFTISEMAQLIGTNNRRKLWPELAARKLSEIDVHLKRVQTARKLLVSAVNCGCSRLETCDLIKERQGPHRKTVETIRSLSPTPEA